MFGNLSLTLGHIRSEFGSDLSFHGNKVGNSCLIFLLILSFYEIILEADFILILNFILVKNGLTEYDNVLHNKC